MVRSLCYVPIDACQTVAFSITSALSVTCRSLHSSSFDSICSSISFTCSFARANAYIIISISRDRPFAFVSPNQRFQSDFFFITRIFRSLRLRPLFRPLCDYAFTRTSAAISGLSTRIDLDVHCARVTRQRAETRFSLSLSTCFQHGKTPENIKNCKSYFD
jgi:hypothetical protein